MEANTQAIEKPDYASAAVDVVAIWKTIQGEGPFCGMPAAFIRMAGCNLQCIYCDTNYTAPRKIMSPAAIADQIFAFEWMRAPLVVITGGEPFRQDISRLVELLTNKGCTVQIETNGTLFPPDFPFDKATIVCSPKTNRVNPKLVPFIGAWKYVVSHGKTDPVDGLPLEVLGMPLRVARPPMIVTDIFVQPMDEQNHAQNLLHLQAAVQSCLKFGYRLCLQMHKIAGVA